MSAAIKPTLSQEALAEAEPPRVTGLGQHYLRYSTATIVMMAAGLISFPILTRLLDNTQFGILGYYDTWLVMAATILKLGGQHAILRLYPFGGDEARMTHFTTNLVFVPMMVSFGVWAVAVVALGAVSWWGGLAFPAVFWCVVVLVPMIAFVSQIEMTLRVSERSGLLTTTRVSWRWLETLLVLGIVALVHRSALSVYAGKITAALILVAFYVHWARRHLRFSREALDLGAYRDSLRYGLPLVANEIAAMSLITIDRIMLKHLAGDFHVVGIFTIGCALAMQVSLIMSDPLWASFNPVVNRVHGTEGAAQVRALKARALLPVTYVSIGIGAAIWAVGADVLVLLAGTDKTASGPVFAWLGAMFALLPVLDLSGYGLLLKKRTITVLTLTVLTALLNIGLNLLWIPTHGVMGAVYATVVSFSVLTVSRCVLCPRELFKLPDPRVLLVAIAAAAVFLGAVRGAGLLDLAAPSSRLALAGGLWLLCYVLPALALDPRLRRLVIDRWPRARLGR